MVLKSPIIDIYDTKRTVMTTVDETETGLKDHYGVVVIEVLKSVPWSE